MASERQAIAAALRVWRTHLEDERTIDAVADAIEAGTFGRPLGATPPAPPEEPECPGPDCMMCNGEACALCGAGCSSGLPETPCEHDVDERHREPVPAPEPAPEPPRVREFSCECCGRAWPLSDGYRSVAGHFCSECFDESEDGHGTRDAVPAPEPAPEPPDSHDNIREALREVAACRDIIHSALTEPAPELPSRWVDPGDHVTRRLAALRAEKKRALQQRYGIEQCAACSRCIDAESSVPCDDEGTRLCEACAAELRAAEGEG